MRVEGGERARGSRALRVMTAVTAVGLVGALFGVQAATQAQAAGPVLTASSSSSQVSGLAAPAVEGAATTDGEQGGSAAPVLTSSSYTSQVTGARFGAQNTPSPASSATSDGQPASTPTGGSADAAANVGDTFSMDADCAACHAGSAERMADEGFTGELHKDLTCITCHSDEAQLTEAHAEHYSAKQASRVVTLVNTTVDPNICFTCHGDQETIAQATADVTDLTDKNGTTINPHELPAVDEHGAITCGSCHKMHDDKTAVEASQNTCLNCHHDNVYECGTCHAV